MRKTYNKAFKAKITLEAIRSEKTIQETVNAYCVHPNLKGKGSVEEAEAERKQDELYRQVENDFLYLKDYQRMEEVKAGLTGILRFTTGGGIMGRLRLGLRLHSQYGCWNPP
jgi:hypothetical protein